MRNNLAVFIIVVLTAYFGGGCAAVHYTKTQNPDGSFKRVVVIGGTAMQSNTDSTNKSEFKSSFETKQGFVMTGPNGQYVTDASGNPLLIPAGTPAITPVASPTYLNATFVAGTNPTREPNLRVALKNSSSQNQDYRIWHNGVLVASLPVAAGVPIDLPFVLIPGDYIVQMVQSNKCAKLKVDWTIGQSGEYDGIGCCFDEAVDSRWVKAPNCDRYGFHRPGH